MSKLIDLIKKCWASEVLRYIFWGGCTTLVNLGVYYLLRFATAWNFNVINVISVSMAILFAYFVNSRSVFRSKAADFSARFAEFAKFVGARLSTLVIEVGGVWLMVSAMHIPDRIGKLIVQFVVLALNYVFSKFLVFTKGKKKS